MNSTNSITIHYCPTCQVGIDATLSKQLACPRCGQKRKRVGGYQWSMRSDPAGWAAELPIEIEAVFGKAEPAER